MYSVSLAKEGVHMNKTNKSKRSLMNFEIKTNLSKRFIKICVKKGLSRSEVIRGLIDKYVEEQE